MSRSAKAECAALWLGVAVGTFWIVALAWPMSVAAQRAQIDRLEARTGLTESAVMDLRLEQRAMRVQIDQLERNQTDTIKKLDQILTAVISLLVAIVGWALTNLWGQRKFNRMERHDP